jgi:hypothetical protein
MAMQNEDSPSIADVDVEAGDQPRHRYLFAASAAVPAAVFERHFPELAATVVDEDVEVLDTNRALVQSVRSHWPGCKVLPTPKSRSSTRSVLSDVQRLVLYWDGEDLSRLLFEARVKKIQSKVRSVQVTRVVNKKVTSEFDVYIGRGSPWGNPFAISHSDDGPDRAEVIAQYEEYFYKKIENDPGFRKGILGLRGLRLACFCKPEACHGDVIAKYLDEVIGDD